MTRKRVHPRGWGYSGGFLSQGNQSISTAPWRGQGLRDMAELPLTFQRMDRASACSPHHNDRPRQGLTGQILGLLSRTRCAQVGRHCLQRRKRVNASQVHGHQRKAFHGDGETCTANNGYLCHQEQPEKPLAHWTPGRLHCARPRLGSLKSSQRDRTFRKKKVKSG